MSDYPKPWMCPSGNHILGQVVRTGGIRRLDIYREAVYPDDKEPVIVAENVTGSIKSITCSICGRTRHWSAAEEGMRALIQQSERWKARNESLLSE